MPSPPPCPVLRFATDRHSLTVSQNNSASRDYSLSVARLPSSSSASEVNKTATDTHNDPGESSEVCLAHSSVSWEGPSRSCESNCHESSLQAFAMAQTPPPEKDTNTKEQKSSDNNSLVTHGSHSLSEAGKDGTSIEAVAANIDSGGGAGKVKRTNYYLKAKMHQEKIQSGALESGSDKPKRSTRTVIIPLDFRPMSVHATEIRMSTHAERNDKGSVSCCEAIGVFVASVEDNKLRLFVATKETCENGGHPYFVPVPLFEGAQGLDDGPLNFSTPIMAIDAVSARRDDREKYHTNVNHLAIACYDGTVRIITYQLKNDSSLYCCCVGCATFIVDGPVVSLHFGITGDPSLPHPSSHLFLVAGSLCGFACLFHEAPLLPSFDNLPQNGSTPFFDGPLTVLDGLYDARQEGYEDCVTSVHACSGCQPSIAVGTQGGRVLLFQRYRNEESDQHESEDQAMTFHEDKDELVSDQNKTEISRLQSEIDEMKIHIRILKEVITEREQKESEPECHAGNTDSLQPKPASKGNKISVDENNEATPTNDRNLDETTHLELAPTELLLLERKVADHASNIVALTAIAADLDRQITARKKLEREQASLHAGYVTRKLHRYRISSEYQLPYPVHGIASSERRDEDGTRDIFVTTRRSFHVLCSDLPQSATSRRRDMRERGLVC